MSISSKPRDVCAWMIQTAVATTLPGKFLIVSDSLWACATVRGWALTSSTDTQALRLALRRDSYVFGHLIRLG